MTPPVTVMLPVTLRNETVAWAFLASDDLDRLGRISLRLGSHGYAVVAGAGRELLHRAVLGLSAGDTGVVDHIDRNKMNCTRSNLRIGTQGQNVQNLSRSPHCGTYPNKKRWGARVKENGRTKYLGTFDTREEAAEVAREYRRRHYEFITEL